MLGRAAAATIAVSILLIAGVAAAGPSAIVAPIRPAWPMPPWWFSLQPSDLPVAGAICAAVILGAAGVGCGLLAVRRGARPAIRGVLAGAAIAVGLLTVLPPAGSTDSISYATYGRIADIGHNPYEMTPFQLRATGDPVGLQTTRHWETDPSLYGPLATAAQWGAAKLGGTSIGRIIFWLKLLFALAFAAIGVTFDRLLRADPAARARAHLLWSVNPLMLWSVLGGAHIDGLAAGLGVIGLIVARPPAGRPATVISPARALAAGMLVGAAVAIKSPFALLVIGLGWALRRAPAALAAGAAGIAVVLVPGYVIAGPAAIRDLSTRGGGLVTFDSFWRLFYPPFGYAIAPPGLMVIASLCCLALAVLLARRLPPGLPGLPAIRPALVVVLAWLFVWPLQRAWYDVIMFALLAIFPATRLDWLVLVRSVPATLDLVTGGTTHRISPAWLHWANTHLGTALTPAIRLAAVVVLVVLCVTATWNPRQPSLGSRVALEPPRPDRHDGTATPTRRDLDADGMAGARRLMVHDAARPAGAVRSEDQQGDSVR
jgi:hypothetical protein